MPAPNRPIKTVEEVMIPLYKYPHVTCAFTIKQALAEMVCSQIEVEGVKSQPRYLLVFDELSRLQGTVRRRDILRFLQPVVATCRAQAEDAPAQFDSEVIKAMREKLERPVTEIMMPLQHTINCHASLLEAMEKITSVNISFLPVMKWSKVVGVIRSVDVLRELALLLA